MYNRVLVVFKNKESKNTNLAGYAKVMELNDQVMLEIFLQEGGNMENVYDLNIIYQENRQKIKRQICKIAVKNKGEWTKDITDLKIHFKDIKALLISSNKGNMLVGYIGEEFDHKKDVLEYREERPVEQKGGRMMQQAPASIKGGKKEDKGEYEDLNTMDPSNHVTIITNGKEKESPYQKDRVDSTEYKEMIYENGVYEKEIVNIEPASKIIEDNDHKDGYYMMYKGICPPDRLTAVSSVNVVASSGNQKRRRMRRRIVNPYTFPRAGEVYDSYKDKFYSDLGIPYQLLPREDDEKKEIISLSGYQKVEKDSPLYDKYFPKEEEHPKSKRQRRHERGKKERKDEILPDEPTYEKDLENEIAHFKIQEEEPKKRERHEKKRRSKH